MKNIKIVLITALMTLGLVVLAAPLPAEAKTNLSAACNTKEGRGSVICQQQKGSGAGVNSLLENIVSILMFILGAISVIMIVIGGIRYTTSGGDASQIKSAKDTILYSVVGLVVAIFAYAIVKFVLNNI